MEEKRKTFSRDVHRFTDNKGDKDKKSQQNKQELKGRDRERKREKKKKATGNGEAVRRSITSYLLDFQAVNVKI